MNFSVGFQAPSGQDLWSAFADKLIDENRAETRFGDKGRTLQQNDSQLSKADVGKLRDFMLSQVNDDALFKTFIGSVLTQSHHAQELLIPAQPIDDTILDDLFSEEELVLTPINGLKVLYIEDSDSLFINGDCFDISGVYPGFVEMFAKKQQISTETAKYHCDCLKNKQLLTNVLNKGYWYID